MHNLMSQETSATRQQLWTSGMDPATWFLCHVENALNQFTNLIQVQESHRTTNLPTSAMTHRKAYPGQGVCVNTLIKTLIAPYAAPGSCISVKRNAYCSMGRQGQKVTPNFSNYQCHRCLCFMQLHFSRAQKQGIQVITPPGNASPKRLY